MTISYCPGMTLKASDPGAIRGNKFKIALYIWITAHFMFYIFLRVCEQLCTCRHLSLKVPVFTGGFVGPVNIVAISALSSALLCI